MSKLGASLISSALLLYGCGSFIQEPTIQANPRIQNNNISILNGNKDTEPRTYFTDGLVTIKGSYSKWAQYLITSYAEKIEAATAGKVKGKTIEINIHAISCSGSFVTTCTITALVSLGNGESAMFSTENIYGYGALPTTEKSLDHIVSMMLSDSKINSYIYQP